MHIGIGINIASDQAAAVLSSPSLLSEDGDKLATEDGQHIEVEEEQ